MGKNALSHPRENQNKPTLIEKASLAGGFFIKRHRAIFPGLEDPSIVTAERLDCCVRYGNRYFPLAMGTENASL